MGLVNKFQEQGAHGGAALIKQKRRKVFFGTLLLLRLIFYMYYEPLSCVKGKYPIHK